MNRLKMLREEKQLLQSDIAKIIDTTPQAVGLYEAEKRDMNTEVLSKLADFFNVSIDYLLAKSDVRNNQKIELDDVDINFASRIKSLNKENQEIAKSIIEGLLSKQKDEENNNKK